MKRLIGLVMVSVAMISAGCDDKSKQPPQSQPQAQAQGQKPACCPAGPAATAPSPATPRIAVDLPDKYNTPDGMTLDKQGNILISIPNFNDATHPAVIAKITPDDKIEEWFKLPVPADSKAACPLGIDFASDGNLYVADCQGFAGGEGANYKSRMLRITVKDGKPVKCDVVVEGLVFINAIACFGDSVYCTESKFEPNPAKSPINSGVYRFKLSELDKAQTPIKVSQGGADPHVVYKLSTKNEQWKVGANGLGFAADGTMYVCNFGDAALVQVRFDAAGKVASEKEVAQGGAMKSTDGLKVCPKTGCVVIADFLGNAVHCVNPATGKVVTIAQNGNGTGAGGHLDKPSEVCLRNGKIYVSNIDLNLDGNKFDKPYTVSVIEMDCSACGKK